MPIKTIFLDRDGVINQEVEYLNKIEDFNFINGVFDACKYLIKLKYKIIIITNQSGISHGYYSEDDFMTINNWMLRQFKKNGIKILDVFYCPHNANDNCSCRKPKPGMILKATNKHNIDLKNSWLIGDKEADIIAANNAGISNTILVKSGHRINKANSNAKYILDSIKYSNQVIIS